MRSSSARSTIPWAFGFEVGDFVAHNGGGGRIRPVCGVGNDDLLAGVALALMVGADHEDAGELAVCAGGGWRVMASMPVISMSASSRVFMICRQPWERD